MYISLVVNVIVLDKRLEIAPRRTRHMDTRTHLIIYNIMSVLRLLLIGIFIQNSSKYKTTSYDYPLQ